MIRACIFDLDDTLVSSGPVWQQAEAALYRKLGGTFDATFAETYKGLSAADVGRCIWERMRPSDWSAEQCGIELRKMLISLAALAGSELSGATSALSGISGRLVVAIASGSPAPVIEVVLRRYNWNRFVSGFVSSEEVPQGKPAPDVFLEASRRIGCLPDECVVVEDSVHGIRAAASAGMETVAIPSSDEWTEIRRFADICLNDLCELEACLADRYSW